MHHTCAHPESSTLTALCSNIFTRTFVERTALEDTGPPSGTSAGVLTACASYQWIASQLRIHPFCLLCEYGGGLWNISHLSASKM